MQVVIEITLYPLHNDYIAAVDDLLARLNAQSQGAATTNRVSTILHGEYVQNMALVQKVIPEIHEKWGEVAFVLKILPGVERSINGYS
jgi:uncharacterized protein YqgV (UPF0045/DUF77 family)